MSVKNILIILSAVAVFGEAAFVDTLKQCSIKDKECQRSVLQKVLKEYGKTGIPEYNVPVFEPVTLKDISLPLLNVVNLTLVEGRLKGLSGCIVNKFDANFHKKYVSLDVTCDLTLKGNYRAISEGPLIRSVLGGDSLVGDGKTKVKIDKFNAKFNVNIDVKSRNGDTYIVSRDDKLNYQYDVLGKVAFVANNLLLDGKDVSVQVTDLLNQSWRLVMQTVGDQIMARAIDTARELIKNIFDNVPSKYFLSEDLTPYVS